MLRGCEIRPSLQVRNYVKREMHANNRVFLYFPRPTYCGVIQCRKTTQLSWYGASGQCWTCARPAAAQSSASVPQTRRSWSETPSCLSRTRSTACPMCASVPMGRPWKFHFGYSIESIGFRVYGNLIFQELDSSSLAYEAHMIRMCNCGPPESCICRRKRRSSPIIKGLDNQFCSNYIIERRSNLLPFYRRRRHRSILRTAWPYERRRRWWICPAPTKCSTYLLPASKTPVYTWTVLFFLFRSHWVRVGNTNILRTYIHQYIN